MEKIEYSVAVDTEEVTSDSKLAINQVSLSQYKDLLPSDQELLACLSGFAEKSNIGVRQLDELLGPAATIGGDFYLTAEDRWFSTGYLFDYGDALNKSRISLYVNRDGNLTGHVIDSQANVFSVKYNVSHLLDGQRMAVAMVWKSRSVLKLFLNGHSVGQTSLRGAFIRPHSTFVHWGSDLEGANRINLRPLEKPR